MQILPQGLCVYGQGRRQELHSTGSGVYSRILWHCSRLHSRWKSREKCLATQNCAAVTQGWEGFVVRTQNPSAGMLLVGCRRCWTSPQHQFPGNGTPHPAASWEQGPTQALQEGGWAGKYSLYFLWLLCQTAKSYIKGNWQGQGKEQKRQGVNQDIFPLVYQLNKGYQLMRFHELDYFSLRGTACDLWLSYSFTDRAAIKGYIIYCFLLCHAQPEMASIKRD